MVYLPTFTIQTRVWYIYLHLPHNIYHTNQPNVGKYTIQIHGFYIGIYILHTNGALVTSWVFRNPRHSTGPPGPNKCRSTFSTLETSVLRPRPGSLKKIWSLLTTDQPHGNVVLFFSCRDISFFLWGFGMYLVVRTYPTFGPKEHHDSKMP